MKTISSPYTRITLTGDMNPASSQAARDYYARKHAAERQRRQHGMPRPAIERKADPYTHVVIDLPASAASPTCPPCPIPPREEKEWIDYGWARQQVEQAQHCASGILDFLAEAGKITPAAAPPAKIERFVDAIVGELNRIAEQLRDLDLHQPFQE